MIEKTTPSQVKKLVKWMKVEEVLHIGNTGVTLKLLKTAGRQASFLIEATPDVKITSERALLSGK